MASQPAMADIKPTVAQLNDATTASGSARTFQAMFKKVPGTLSVTQTHVAWVPTKNGAMDRQQQAMNRVTNMLASKAGSARISLMLKFKDDVPQGGLLFTFTGANKEAERQQVQDLLIPFVTANRAGPGTPAPAPAGPSGTPASAATALTSGIAAIAERAQLTATPGPSTPGTPSASTPGTPGGSRNGKRKADDGPGADAAARKRTYQLRLRVLRKNPTLKMLHRELVLGEQITEDEFWDGREALLKAEELQYAQRPGRPSRLLDDRFDLTGGKKDKSQGGTGVGVKKVDAGPIVLNITKDLTREIFEEFPVVQDAYAKNVPRISEAQFWMRYFTSTLWERHRASVRKSTADEVSRKKDDIFDAYLEDPDWDPTPRKQMPDAIEKFLDLQATEEDHGESTTVRDVTMQAGKERSSLPLIRRFNDHSERLLMAGRPAGAADGVYDENELLQQIEYDDLLAPAAPSTIPIDVTEGKSASEKDDTVKGIMPGKSEDELQEIAAAESRRIRKWHLDFAAVCMPNPVHGRTEGPVPEEHREQYEAFTFQRDAQATAAKVVHNMHMAANAEDAVYPSLPDQILEQMRSCHNAASEFLRQYWSAVLPTPPGALGAGTASCSPAARADRAAKMAKYLDGTGAKVQAIVHTAQISGVDPERIKAAMAATLGAVNVALKREKVRIGGK